jgi:hypothetical protein
LSTAAARALRLVARVDALWENGPPARGVVAEIDDEGEIFFRVSALRLTCERCGISIPQSRSRISREARAAWLTHHVACPPREPR